MNRRRFLGMMAAVAAAAVGVVKAKKPEPTNLYGSRMIDKPFRPDMSKVTRHVFAAEHARPTVDSLPTDIVSTDILVWRDSRYEVLRHLS